MSDWETFGLILVLWVVFTGFWIWLFDDEGR